MPRARAATDPSFPLPARSVMSFRLSTVLLLAGLAPLATPSAAAGQEPPHYDMTFVGGHVIDGSGNPWFQADVAVRDGRIVKVGDLGTHTATRTIDARGLTVAPGFVDLHSHAGDRGRGNDGLTDTDPRYRAAANLVAQGVTTLVANQDGRSPWPIRNQGEQMRRLGTGPNTILLVGHGRLRTEVMGEDFRRPATPEEVEQMRELLREGLDDGAYGMSAGHEYTPMIWSETEEVVALAEEVAAVGGIYVVHERSSGREPMWWWPSQDEDGAPHDDRRGPGDDRGCRADRRDCRSDPYQGPGGQLLGRFGDPGQPDLDGKGSRRADLGRCLLLQHHGNGREHAPHAQVGRRRRIPRLHAGGSDRGRPGRPRARLQGPDGRGPRDSAPRRPREPPDPGASREPDGGAHLGVPRPGVGSGPRRSGPPPPGNR